MKLFVEEEVREIGEVVYGGRGEGGRMVRLFVEKEVREGDWCSCLHR